MKTPNSKDNSKGLSRERVAFLQRDYSRGFIRHCDIEAEEISRGRFTSRVKIRGHHRQQDGFIHAGLMATMADHTAGYAAFTIVDPDYQILTIEFKINFLRPAWGDYLRCEANVIKEGTNVIVAESDLLDVRGPCGERPVAKAIVTLMAVHKSRLESRQETTTL